jgi:cell wall-associated NlpC family hydrolase
MIFSVFSNPALGYATTEADASGVTNTTAVNEPSDVTETLNEDEVESEKEESLNDVAEKEETSEGEKKETVIKVAKVSGLKVKAVSSKAIRLTWNKVKGATGYQVYRYNKAKGKYVLCYTTKKVSWQNSSLKANTNYSYKVRAYKVKNNEKHFGAFSKVVKGKTKKTDQAKISTLALKKVGCQYKSGAKGPTKFDCSGFVKFCYSYMGVDIHRISYDQATNGYEVSRENMQPGDILCFASSVGGDYIGHTGIYVGDGQFIHSPREGYTVEIIPLTSGSYSQRLRHIRRIFN